MAEQAKGAGVKQWIKVHSPWDEGRLLVAAGGRVRDRDMAEGVGVKQRIKLYGPWDEGRLLVAAGCAYNKQGVRW